MARHLDPDALPMGALWTARNLMAQPKRLKKRPGYIQIMAGSQVSADDQPLYGLAPLWKTDGSQVAVLLTNRYLYQFAKDAAPTVKHWQAAAASGTISNTGTAVTGVSTEFNSAHADGWIKAGDYLVIDPNGSDGTLPGPTVVKVASVTNDTSLTLDSDPGRNYSGEDYYTQHSFAVEEEHLLDWTVVAGATNKVMVCDGSRPIRTYDGTTHSVLSATMLYLPRAILYFGGSRSDRLWMGNVVETTTDSIKTEVDYRQRIRWSSATDVTSFSAADYIDLPYASGAIRKLLNIQHIMIVYLTDAVFYGRPSNDPDLPYTFDMLKTDGVGLVGKHAVVSHKGGHFFVGQDNIYYMDANLTREEIGTPVVEDTIRACSNPNYIWTCADPKNNRILFAFPESGEEYSKTWSFDYQAKEWSYDEVEGTFLSNPLLSLSATIDGLTGTIDGLGSTYPTIDSMGAGLVSTSKVYRGATGYVYELSDDGADDDGVAVGVTLETGDLDFGKPSEDKTAHRLSLRLADRPSGDLTFTLSTSLDGGNTFTSQGPFTIASNKREGYVDFFATGSAIRLRLVSTSSVESYTIVSAVLKVSGRGLEVTFR